MIRFAGADASKVQEVIDQLGGQIGSGSIKVTVKTKQKRPWWRFWHLSDIVAKKTRGR